MVYRAVGSCKTKLHVYFDTASVNVFCDYCNTDDDTPFKIAEAYGKDKRQDLKLPERIEALGLIPDSTDRAIGMATH